MEQEAWLTGVLENISPMLMPAAHALVQSSRDVKLATTNVNDAELWLKPGGAPSVGFHLLHIAGSCDRLLTYARGATLSAEQFTALTAESEINLSMNAISLTENAAASIDNVIDEIILTPEKILFEQRVVGRGQLQTNVFGLLFHIAEHTQRHVGQIIATVKFARLAANKNSLAEGEFLEIN